jgi:hypothetical protein
MVLNVKGSAWEHRQVAAKSNPQAIGSVPAILGTFVSGHYNDWPLRGDNNFPPIVS